MKKITFLTHSENPPTRQLLEICQRHNWHPTVVRVPFGEAFPTVEETDGLIILGAAANVYNHPELLWMQREIAWIEQALQHNIPTFGVCLGVHLLTHIYGGTVVKGDKGREFSYTPVHPTQHSDTLFGIELNGADVFQAHGDTYTLPSSATQLLRGEVYEQQAAKFAPNVYGVQFHPEITPDVAQRWHEYGLANGREFAPNIPQTPAEHAAWVAEKQKPIHAWLERFLSQLFQ